MQLFNLKEIKNEMLPSFSLLFYLKIKMERELAKTIDKVNEAKEEVL
jgi:hypothetical protein